jgi:uncharacterized metal-binding protein YceD (DUF177 family)
MTVVSHNQSRKLKDVAYEPCPHCGKESEQEHVLAECEHCGELITACARCVHNRRQETEFCFSCVDASKFKEDE